MYAFNIGGGGVICVIMKSYGNHNNYFLDYNIIFIISILSVYNKGFGSCNRINIYYMAAFLNRIAVL